MNPSSEEHGDHLIEIFNHAKAKAAGEERERYLAEVCGGDAVRRAEVDEVLRAHDAAGSFLNAGQAVSTQLDAEFARLKPEQAGERIRHYKLLEKIGEGGFGDVWMAEQREPIKRRLALKIIKPGMDSRQIVARFEAERQALAMMDHANIARIFDAGVTDTGRPYFVMELVRGLKITEYCDENQLPTPERLRLFIVVCQAIQHAHQKGIIHRDIKPSNILVTLHDGVPVPKVIDFGIAKATQQELTDKTVFTQFQQFMGTPAYISPEQAEMSGLDIDTRADIYSLGVLLYELLVGQTPFDAKEMTRGGIDALRQIIRQKEPLRPSTKLNTLQGDARITAGKRRQTEVERLVHQLQGDLDWIVMKCLEKDRGRRYATANGLATDINRHLNNEPIAARPPSWFYRFQKAVQRNKLAFGSAAAIALALLIGLTVSVKMGLKARREAARSRHVAQFLKDMLEGAGRNAALGRDTTFLREIADHAAENVRTRLQHEPEVAMELNLVLVKVYADLLEFEKMAESAQEARRLAPGSIGNETFPYADATSFLGRALLGLGKLKEAETTAREAIAIQRRVRGAGSIEEAESLRCLGDALRGLDRLSEAESAIVKSVEIFRQRLGNDTSEVAWALNSLNIVLGEEGKLVEAERVIREAIAIRTKLPPGREPLAVGWHYERLAATIMSSGATNRLPEAEELLLKAIEVESQVAGKKYPALAWPHLRMARLLERQARLAEAEVHYRAAAEVARGTQGLSKDQRALFVLQLGRFLGRAGKQQESSALISESQSMSSTPRL
jgi:serine/threonine protein kinase/tetratricopeptide (TPR) repeat protein